MPAPSLEGKGAAVGGGPWEGAGQQMDSGARETRRGSWPSSLQMMGVALRAGTPHGPASARPSSPEPRGRPTPPGGRTVLAPPGGAPWSLPPKRKRCGRGLCPHGQGSLLRPQPPIWSCLPFPEGGCPAIAHPLRGGSARGARPPAPDSGQEPGPILMSSARCPAALGSCRTLHPRPRTHAAPEGLGSDTGRWGAPQVRPAHHTAVPRAVQAGQADSHRPLGHPNGKGVLS